MLRYLTYPPIRVSDQRRWPLIVFLHGSGERGDDLSLVKRYGAPRYLEDGLRIPAFVVAPQCPSAQSWDLLIEELERLVDQLLARLPVDETRVSLTGFSLGGFGAWDWALRHPARFAALAPVAGCGSGGEGTVELDAVCTLRDLPIWIFHGASDRHVPAAGADAYADRLARCGADVRYSRLPGANHGDSCREAYSTAELYLWLSSQQRRARPGT
jgi:predicted peptidase